VERLAIERMIASVNGSITEAARRLGISRATLYRRLKQYQPPGDPPPSSRQSPPGVR
jgi:DNA-binding NtrC family response regulator